MNGGQLDEHRDSFLRALGWVALQGGMLEEALVDLYWVTKQLEETALIEEVRNLTLGPLKNRAMAAFTDWATEADLVRKAEALTERLEKAVRLRNEHIHAGWAFGTSYVTRDRLPRGGVPRGEYLKMTAQDVAAAGDYIGDVAEEVWELYDEVVERIDVSILPARGGMVLPDGTYIPCARNTTDSSKS